MCPASGRSRIPAVLGAVIVAALAIGLRFWRLDWGLTHSAYFPDESDGSSG